jgi:dihydrofolate reductase
MTEEERKIYESPDGGNTVYARSFGADLAQRTKIYENPEMLKEKAFFERWHMYRDILEASKDNPALTKLLEQVDIIYKLSNEERRTN